MEIILIRHGKPRAATNPRVSAAGFTNWIRHYDKSEVSPTSEPTERFEIPKHYAVLSSDLRRAVHSALLFTEREPIQASLFREMEIPRYKLPIKVKSWTWVYLCRALWMLGLKGRFESFKEAKQRAEIAANELNRIAAQNGGAVLFSHGYLNVFIRRALKKQGWKVTNKSNQYWGVSRLCLD